MRIRILGALVAAALVLPATPAVLPAQQQPAAAASAPQTHTVVKGETLWGLAEQYLGDGHRWPEIYQLNREAIANPHWIYPGQVFKIPGSVTSVAVTVTSPTAVAGADTTPPPSAVPARDTTQPPVAAPPAAPTLPAGAPTPTGANPSTGPTVFPRVGERVASAPPMTREAEQKFPTVLIGEYLSAPYVVKSARIPGAGRIVSSGDLGPQGNIDSRTIFKAFDAVLVQPPRGASGKKGEQYVALQPGPMLFHMGQVMIPTGVVQLTQDQTPGSSAMAQVVALYGEMQPDQILVPLDTDGVFTTVRPQPVQQGPSAKITWTLSEPVLPTLSAYVVLNFSPADNVKPGDQLLVFRAHQRGASASQPGTPDIPIGRAKVVRVTPYGATAIVTGQEQPALNVGASVRVTARMP